MRLGEMEDMARVLDLTSLTVEDLPDGGLKELDPRRIEDVVRRHVERIGPRVIVSYPSHGVSGFDDHLVTHAVVKRVFCELRERGGPSSPRRLAFTTFRDLPSGDRPLRLQTSRAEEIDCAVAVGRKELEAQRSALACYATYQEMIERMNPVRLTGDRLDFEIFQEDHDPPLEDLAAALT